jgi:hypothetical protein
MEYRRHKREAVDQMVRVIRDGRVVFSTRAVDMSPGGLAIQSPGESFNTGQLVDLDFYKPGYPRGISCYLHTVVIHVGPEVMGLKFTEETSVAPGQEATSE